MIKPSIFFLGIITTMFCTASFAALSIDSWCEFNWIPFDEFCYYKPDNGVEFTSHSAETFCQSLRPFYIPNQYVIEWLAFFVFDPKNPPVFRILLGSNKCQCFTYEYNQATGNYMAVSHDCNCDQPMFPLCRYHQRNTLY